MQHHMYHHMTLVLMVTALVKTVTTYDTTFERVRYDVISHNVTLIAATSDTAQFGSAVDCATFCVENSECVYFTLATDVQCGFLGFTHTADAITLTVDDVIYKKSYGKNFCTYMLQKNRQ